MNDMPMPSENSADADQSIMVNMSSLGPDAANLKVGDTVEMKISAIQGDMVSLAPTTSADDSEDEDNDPATMPLDKLEASLPKAER